MLPKIFFTKGFYLTLIFLIASCGQKGELYLPDETSKDMMEISLFQSISETRIEQPSLDE